MFYSFKGACRIKLTCSLFCGPHLIARLFTWSLSQEKSGKRGKCW